MLTTLKNNVTIAYRSDRINAETYLIPVTIKAQHIEAVFLFQSTYQAEEFITFIIELINETKNAYKLIKELSRSFTTLYVDEATITTEHIPRRTY